MGYCRRVLLVALMLLSVSRVWAEEEEKLVSIFDRLEKPRGLYGKIPCQVEQPVALRLALDELHARNHQKPGMMGYRVRVYRSIGRAARQGSQAAVDTVLRHFEGLPTYRSYASPYYMVAVGDCRTRYEALALQKRLLHLFPQAFVVSGHVNFPRVGVYRNEE